MSATLDFISFPVWQQGVKVDQEVLIWGNSYNYLLFLYKYSTKD